MGATEPLPRPEPALLDGAEALDRLRGIGPKVAEQLGRAGLHSLADLLLWLPRRVQEVRERDEPSADDLGHLVRFAVEIQAVSRSWLPGRRSLVRVRCRCLQAAEEAEVELAFFNQPYLKNSWQAGERREVEGSLDRQGRRWVLKTPRVLPREHLEEGPCLLRYREVEGIGEARLRGWIARALECTDLRTVLRDTVPAGLRDQLPDPRRSLVAIHRPTSVEAYEEARRGFALLEALRMFRRIEELRRRRRALPSRPLQVDADRADAQLARCLPFDLTEGQRDALHTLRQQMGRDHSMAVLLQGDVGTGKTAVAIGAALTAIAAGAQVAFLAPTELLAEQHFHGVGRWLESEGIRTGLLTGGSEARARRALEERMVEGTVDLVFGTHALFSTGTRFHALGLAIVDEQHRFGVAQRARLAAKGGNPHVLVMTATPIPRTLTMALFGDLDPLTLRERPGGKRAPRARFLPRKSWPRVLQAIERRRARGERVYVVCPRIGADGQKGGVVLLHEQLREHFGDRVGLVHGQQPLGERQHNLERFRSGASDILVGTTVLEVGIDVPQATLMVIVGCERLGLATLHQLRGRVGRGARSGLCILTGEPSARSVALCRSTDGFELAEEDLRQRGAGELLGQRQSGAWDFAALDPLRDLELLRTVRREVTASAKDEPAEER